MEALEVDSPGGGIVLFSEGVCFLVDASSTPSIGVSSIVFRVSALSLAEDLPAVATLRFLRKQSHLNLGVKQCWHIPSRAAPVISVVLPSIFLSLRDVPLGPPVSATATTDIGRADGKTTGRT